MEVNYSKILEFFEGDEEVLENMYSIFKKKYDIRMDGLSAAIEKNDADNLSHVAHSLKGAVDYFQINSISSLAQELEIMGENGEFNGAMEIYVEMKSLLDDFLVSMDAKIKDLKDGVA